MDTALEEWSKSVMVPLINIQGMSVTARLGAMLESGHLKESGRVQERG